MHILFVHQNFPAQFGHVASYLARHRGYRCTFVSQKPAGTVAGIERIPYHIRGGATKDNHYCSRTFENCVWHAHAVFEALKARPDVRPDLIVGHSGFGSTLFLRELYGRTPIINYFEYYYRPTNSDMDFRPDVPSSELNRLRAWARNAMLLLDLENCDIGYSPTHWQRDCFPKLVHDRIRVIFDGVDSSVWKPEPDPPRMLGQLEIPPGKKIVTYATRGMESMRGFDIFMKVAKRVADRRDDVLFLIAGEDRVCYGGDQVLTGKQTFKQWVLSQDNYDLSRFIFLGLVSPPVLARLFNLSDVHVYLTVPFVLSWSLMDALACGATVVHVYLTVPFVLSWSLMDALACGATVVASDTEPVREMIRHGQNGLLADFFDIEGMAGLVEDVLDRPERFRHLGQAGAAMIQQQYSLDVCLPQMLGLYDEAIERSEATRGL